jgi:hypothetical protein
MNKRQNGLEHWDEIQHDPVSDPPDNFNGMEIEEAVALIATWFFRNFEDPAHHTPYISAEGGYQYIWGGPYDTRDIIENVFADSASEELITAAIEEIENEGFEWVPNSSRRQPPEEWDPEPKSEEATLHGEMQTHIAALEEALARLPKTTANLGHNNPPEPIHDLPLNIADRRELADALKILKVQPSKPPKSEIGAIGTALSTIEAKTTKAQEWLARQADTFFSEATKEAGKEFGKWAPRAIWLYLIDHLLGLSKTAAAWLQSLQPPF